jgi:enterochelin esterase family protein
MKTRTFLPLATFAASTVFGQQQPPSPPTFEVHPDHTVTFRWNAPNAKEVFLNREGTQKAVMQKDDQGWWTVTTETLAPDLYGYSFQVDGVNTVDPTQPLLKPNLLNVQSMVHVPDPALPWEVTNVPHGEVHHHYYHSRVVGDDRDYYVYTPPGYDPNASKKYPVLYLLHGFSDDASGWTSVGRANIIVDNLIAQSKAKPMLIVMTLGYGAPEIVQRNAPTPRPPDLAKKNYENYRAALLNEVIPAVEKEYRVNTDRTARAIAGLSMGGAETLFVGLNAPDKFAYIASFSAGGLAQNYDQTFPALSADVNSKLRLLWIACGTEDRLIEPNRKFRDWLTSKNIKFTPIETPGAHTWMVWRRNLTTVTPLLFQ